jgi:hypothetical protein
MVYPQETPTALASHERKPAIAHVSSAMMVRKPGAIKTLGRKTILVFVFLLQKFA